MPQFHLHISTHAGLISDEEGAPFPNLAAARTEAIRGARSLVVSEVLGGVLNMRQSIRIHGEAGQHLETVRFDEAVKVIPDDRDEPIESLAG